MIVATLQDAKRAAHALHVLQATWASLRALALDLSAAERRSPAYQDLASGLYCAVDDVGLRCAELDAALTAWADEQGLLSRRVQ